MSEDDSGGSTMELATDIGPSVKSSATSQMDAAIVALSRDLAKLRTGRASAGIFFFLLDWFYSVLFIICDVMVKLLTLIPF